MNELYIEAIKPGNVIELYYYSHVRSYVLNYDAFLELVQKRAIKAAKRDLAEMRLTANGGSSSTRQNDMHDHDNYTDKVTDGVMHGHS